jgi:AcrR family transcriptional regulator
MVTKPSSGGGLRRPLLPVVGQVAAPREERADAARNRERILVALRRLLKKQSIESLCMDELARAAGVGKGTLYRRFPDRAALVHALLDADARALQDRALAGFGLSPTTPSVEHALTLLGEVFDFVSTHRAALEAAHAGKVRERYDHPAYVWQRHLLARHLSMAMRRGEIPRGAPEVLAELMLAGVSPELVGWLGRSGHLPEPARGTLLESWRRAFGLAPRSPAPESRS